QADTFSITLQKNRFFFASLFQKDIDVLVKVISPGDSLIRGIDDLKSGPEFISFTSQHEGLYKIIIQPFNPMAQKGSYNIELEKNIKAGDSNTNLTNHIFAELDNKYRTGIAAAVVDSGKVVYKNWFGMADLEDKVPVKPSTRLNICSIGKQFTAYAIALLEQQGKLSINDEIHKYLPKIYKFNHKITISDLLNHSSGLREIADLLELTGKRSGGPFSKEDVFNLIYSQRELNFTPGTEYMYCNTSYILLAEIIKRITGESYINWITENIFKPLGMNKTFIFYNKDSLNNDVAESYTLGNDGDYHKEELYNCWYVGAGNIFSTVEDMSKWLINFDYPKVGNKQTVLKL
ncbi:MAG: serine hydrolase, partial [Ignavibacteriaceae bacterium]